MKRLGPLALTALTIGLVAHPVSGQEPKDRSAEEQAIAKNGEAYIVAFHKGDATALAAFWVADGDYAIQTGRQLKGREAIEKELTAMFAEHKGLKVQIDSESLRFVTPDVAVEDGVSTVVPADGALPTRSRFTNVHVKKDGKWLLSSVRESPYSPPTNAEHLRGFAWAVGEWAGDGDSGATTHLSLSWTDNQNFLVASLAARVKGETVRSGTHWIGWDPVGKRVRSWVFDGDGGFGEGAWTRDGDGWVIKLSSVLPDGKKGTATLHVARGDGDTLRLSVNDRTVDGTAIPDVAEAKLKRAK